MATLYDQAGAVVATGLTVLRESNLAQRRTDVVHDPLAGGLPYIVLKAPGGLAGNLELLCPSGEVADAVYAAHIASTLLRIDDWQREQLLPDPHLRTVPFVPSSGAATVTQGDTFGPNGHGYLRVKWTTANTTSPQTIPLVGSGLAQMIPAAPGDVFMHSAFFRRFAWDAGETQVLSVNWHDASGAFMSSHTGPSEVMTSDWTRASAPFTAPAGVAYARPTLIMSGIYEANDDVDFGDALFEAGSELRPFFSGSTSDGDHVDSWTGTANASTSLRYGRPAVDLTYAPVGGVALPVRSSQNYWRVSVPGIQEQEAAA